MRNYLEHLIVLFHSYALIHLIFYEYFARFFLVFCFYFCCVFTFCFVLFGLFLFFLFSFLLHFIACNVLSWLWSAQLILCLFFTTVFYTHNIWSHVCCLLIRCTLCSEANTRTLLCIHTLFFSLFIDFAQPNAQNVNDILLCVYKYVCSRRSLFFFHFLLFFFSSYCIFFFLL